MIYAGSAVRCRFRQGLHADLRRNLYKRLIDLRGPYLRKLALISSAFIVAFLAFASFAHAQQIDVAVGAGTLLSTKNTSASLAYLPAAEKGGTYPSFSADVIFKNRFGFSAELTTRARYGLYNGYQQFRPILYDFNGLYAPRVGKRTGVDLMAGMGGQSVLFYGQVYNQYGNCNYAGTCVNRVNSNHLLVHLGGGIRYSVWRNFFVRPEAHFYRILNNTDFHSGNVLRVGASLGYTFGPE
jgi:hypothetical protein